MRLNSGPRRSIIFFDDRMAITLHSERSEGHSGGDPQVRDRHARRGRSAFLVDRCIRGEKWRPGKSFITNVTNRCVRPFASTWGVLEADTHLVDELAARVWLRLGGPGWQATIEYNARRGSILTFIRLLAEGDFAILRRAAPSEKGTVQHRPPEPPRGRRQGRIAAGQMLADLDFPHPARTRLSVQWILQISADEEHVLPEKAYSSANISGSLRGGSIKVSELHCGVLTRVQGPFRTFSRHRRCSSISSRRRSLLQPRLPPSKQRPVPPDIRFCGNDSARKCGAGERRKDARPTPACNNGALLRAKRPVAECR